MYRVLMLVGLFLLAGCGNANWTSVYREYPAVKIGSQTDTKSVLIDAKQRAIITVPSVKTKPDPNDPFSESSSRNAYVCAEPSPDAVAAVSAAIAASLSADVAGKGGGSAALGIALKESVAQLGRRNATIQLLRDGLYRQCEAYLNGLIDQRGYKSLSNRYVDATVTLLAIEQLTASGTQQTPVSVTNLSGDNSPSRVNAETNIIVEGKPNVAAGQGATNKSDKDQVDKDKVTQSKADDNSKQKKSEDGSANNAPPDEKKEQDKQTQRAASEAHAGTPEIIVNVPDASANTAAPKEIANVVQAITKEYLTKNLRDQCLEQITRAVENAYFGEGSVNIHQQPQTGSVLDLWLEACGLVFASLIDGANVRADIKDSNDASISLKTPSAAPSTSVEGPFEPSTQFRTIRRVTPAIDPKTVQDLEKKVDTLNKEIQKLRDESKKKEE